MTNVGFTKRFWLSLLVNFGGMLGVLTLVRYIAHTNAYVYSVLALAWFVGLLMFDLKLFGGFVQAQWRVFKQQKGRHLLEVIILFILLEVVVALARPVFRRFLPSETISGIVQYHLPTDQLIGLVMSFFISIGDLIAAFVEELAYRYESMYTFRTKGKLVTGIMVIVSSLLFGFSHYYNFNGSFVATMPYVFAGLVLALGYLKTKNFWVPALAHLLFNSIALLSTIFLLIVFIIQKIVG